MSEYSINVCLRTDKKQKRNGKYPIYLRLRVKGKETKVPTGLEVSKENWNDKKKEPKDKALLVQLNKKINDIEIYINRLIVDEQEVTLSVVKDFLSGKKKQSLERQSFFEYYDKFIERKRNEGVEEATINCYITTENVLKKFKREIRISDISLSLIEDFDNYLCYTRNNKAGGRSTKHKNLRTVIRDVIKHKIPIDNPYDGRFKIPQSAVKEVYLSLDELEAMRKLRCKLNHKSTLYKVLQMYLFSCYCGLRYSDIIDLKWENVDFDKQEKRVKGIITKKQVKTKGEVCTPLFTHSRVVLLELSKSKTLLGTDKNVFENIGSTTVNNTLRKLTEMAGIDKYVTFHSARHTFATLMIQQQKMGIFELSKCLGHKTLEMTKRYVKYDLSATINSAKDIEIFG